MEVLFQTYYLKGNIIRTVTRTILDINTWHGYILMNIIIFLEILDFKYKKKKIVKYFNEFFFFVIRGHFNIFP